MLRRRLKNNLIANAYVLVINVLIQLGSVPLFLAYWPKELYGEWLLLYSIPGYLALADVGFSSVASNDAAMRLAAGDTIGAQRSIHTATGFLIIMSLCVGVVMLCLVWLLPWTRILAIHLTAPGRIVQCILILSAYSIVGLYSTLLSAIYRCALQNSRGVYILGSARLIELLLMAGALALGGNFISVSCALLLARVVCTAFMYLDGRNVHAEVCIGYREFSLQELKGTWKSAIAFAGLPLGSAFYYQGLTIAVGHILGPSGVVVFNSVRALTRATVQTLNIIKQAILPEFSHLLGIGNLSKAKQLFQLAMQGSFIVSLFQAALLFAIGPWLMSIWTHDTVVVSRSMLCLYLAGSFFNGLWLISSGTLLGTNKHSGLMALYVVCSAASLVLVWLLRGVMSDISGIGWSMLCCELILLPYALRESSLLFQEPRKSFVAELLSFKQLKCYLFRW